MHKFYTVAIAEELNATNGTQHYIPLCSASAYYGGLRCPGGEKLGREAFTKVRRRPTYDRGTTE